MIKFIQLDEYTIINTDYISYITPEYKGDVIKGLNIVMNDTKQFYVEINYIELFEILKDKVGV